MSGERTSGELSRAPGLGRVLGRVEPGARAVTGMKPEGQAKFFKKEALLLVGLGL